MTVWVIAVLVTCAAPDGSLQPCRMILNSYLGGHTMYLRKKQCLAEVEDSNRRTCVETREE